MPNLYATVTELKSRLGITGTDQDVLLAAALEVASRRVDVLCGGRRFFTTLATRYMDTQDDPEELLLSDDCLGLSALGMDSERDGTFDGETWAENTDWAFWPWASWPAFSIQTLPNGSYSFPKRARRYMRATGVWGYGDGTASPWADSGVTAVVATASGRTLTLGSESIGDLVAGQTLQLGTEQMTLVSATAGTAGVAAIPAHDAVPEVPSVPMVPATALVTRAINGTVGAAHAVAGALSIAQYPVQIVYATLALATRVYVQAPGEILMRETVGDYSYARLLPTDESVQEKLWVSGFERTVLG
jgi:hypothetical protein